MHFTTNARWSHSWLWLFWFLALLALSLSQAVKTDRVTSDLPVGDRSALATVVRQPQPTFPWKPRERWRKWALRHYAAARRAYRRAVWAAAERSALAGRCAEHGDSG
jgi:hypothetical protein